MVDPIIKIIMEANKILSSDLLDIVFETRNKEYGAYELRRQYNTRLSLALFIICGIGLIVFLSSFFIRPAEQIEKPIIRVVELTDITPMEKPLETIEQHKPKETQQTKTEQFVTMVVKPDKEVKKEDMPPPIEDLAVAIIGTEKKDGVDDDGTNQKPVDNTKEAVGDAPADKDNNKPFVKVEIEAEFPGGNGAWFKYISKEIYRNLDELQEDGKSGTVITQFVVDSDGIVSDVKVLPCNEVSVSNCLSNNSKLAEIAVAAVKRGPKWKPAVQNGRLVKAYRRQPITFKLSEE